MLNRYRAINPAGFFTVTTEAFLERQGQLRNLHPELYAELSRFSCLDPKA